MADFSEEELQYLATQRLGRLATIPADGYPQNNPVGFRFNAELGTIDIGGMFNERSAKYRNVGREPKVSFVIDDAVGQGIEGTRFLEIRGEAEQAAELIRIRPRRLVSWNIDPGSPGLHTVNLDAS